MPTLYDIHKDLVHLDEELGEAETLDDPQLQALIEVRMEELAKDLRGKVDGYAALITEWLRRAEIRAAEADRLKKLVAIDERNAATLKERVKQVMESLGFKKVETERFKVSVCGNGGKAPLEIIDGIDIPKQFMYQPPPVPDNNMIREILEAGQELEFARVGPRGTHLRIK